MLEIKMLKNTYHGAIIVFNSILCSLLGFLLLVSLDGYAPTEITISQLQYSIYTVYTQFGIFVFSIIPIFLISNDYKEKNIFFYKTLNYSPIKYMINKIISIMLYTSVGNIIVTFAISMIYMNSNAFLLFFIKIQNVCFYIVVLASLLSYLFSNFIKSFCICFALWIFGIVLSTINSNLYWFSYYDAVLLKHELFADVLDNKIKLDLYDLVTSEFMFNMVILITTLFLTIIFRKRWRKYGI